MPESLASAISTISSKTKAISDFQIIRIKKQDEKGLYYAPIADTKAPNEDCAKNIAEATCVSESSIIRFDAKCSKEKVTKELLKAITDIKKDLPELHQKIFCHLNRIQIHENLDWYLEKTTYKVYEMRGLLSFWEKDAPVLRQRCYYNGDPKSTVDPAQIGEFYAELNRSDFFTSYSTSTILEDFADSTTVWTLLKDEYDFTYKIFDSYGTQVFDVHEAFASDRTKKKREWLDAYFARKDLKFQFEKKP